MIAINFVVIVNCCQRMCIVFIWRQEDIELVGKYKFILAANRDEFFHRPAKEAHYWEDEPNILAGMRKVICF